MLTMSDKSTLSRIAKASLGVFGSLQMPCFAAWSIIACINCLYLQKEGLSFLDISLPNTARRGGVPFSLSEKRKHIHAVWRLPEGNVKSGGSLDILPLTI